MRPVTERMSPAAKNASSHTGSGTGKGGADGSDVTETDPDCVDTERDPSEKIVVTVNVKAPVERPEKTQLSSLVLHTSPVWLLVISYRSTLPALASHETVTLPAATCKPRLPDRDSAGITEEQPTAKPKLWL